MSQCLGRCPDTRHIKCLQEEWKEQAGHIQSFHSSSSAEQKPNAVSATVPREITAKRLTLTLSFNLLHSCSCHNQTQKPVQGSSKPWSEEARRQHEHMHVAGTGASAAWCCSGLSREAWQKVLRWLQASNTLLSSGTASTTPENVK